MFSDDEGWDPSEDRPDIVVALRAAALLAHALNPEEVARLFLAAADVVEAIRSEEGLARVLNAGLLVDGG